MTLNRREYIGSSDAPKIAGVSPYGSALSVWLAKSGMAEDKPSTLRMFLGKRLEPIIVDLWQAKTGKTVEPVVHPDTGEPIDDEGAPILMKGHPHIGAHPDAVRLEIKTSRSKWGWGEDGSVCTVKSMTIPIGYYVQMQHIQMVMDWSEMDMAVLIGHDEVLTYTVPADISVMDDLLIAEQELWDQVQSGERPAQDDPDSRKAYLRAMFPAALEDMRAATPEELGILERWRMARVAEKEAIAAVSAAADAIKERIGKAAGLIDEATWTEAERKSLDRGALHDALTSIDRLDILDAATKRKTYRTLRDKRRETEDST